PEQALRDTEHFWLDWLSGCHYMGDWPEAVRTSLMVLKALTYAPTGGIVAAPTTSLPEHIGGERNWDYRYCWLRDASFTLYALMNAGFADEARRWRDWLLRAVAGDVSRLQILYGVAGERRISELELPWLDGYAGSQPVRIGNAAHEQLQLDVYGEVMDALHIAREHGLSEDDHAWSLQAQLMSTSRAPGHGPTRASGRCAVRAGTSPTPRCSPGSRSTVRSTSSSGSGSTGPPIAGAGRARTSIARSCARASTRS